MDAVFLSPSEDEFVGRITEELEHFMLQGQHHRVLLFPPLSSRLRYLIHRTVENVDLLSSFSVGEGWRRRTVICHSAVRLPSETKPSEPKPSSNPSRLHRPAPPWGRGNRGGRQRHAGDVHGDSSRASVGSGRIQRPPRRKPDKAFYVPKAMRRKAEWGEQESLAAAGAAGNVAPGEEICPKASAGDGQEELGKSEGSPNGVCLTLGEPAEECVSGRSDGSSAGGPPCGVEGPSVEGSNDASGQESQDKACPGSLSSAHNQSPAEAEEQDCSCDNVVAAEGSKIPCQLQGEKQPSQEAGTWECSKTSSPSEGASRSCCTGPVVAESSAAVLLLLENQDKSCAAARSLERGGNESLPEEQAKGSGSAGTGEEGGSSKLQSQDQECPSDVQLGSDQNPPEAPNEPQAVPEPDPAAAEEQKEAWVDAPGQNHSGKGAEEEDKEGPGLWDELHLSAGDKEESRGGPGQGSPEDDCTAELFAEIVNYLSVKDISIEKISFDYSTYGEAQLTEGDFGHVTEIYDFSPSMKTEQLLEVFSDFHESGFKIQWVDDTHALGIFSSLSTASQALGRRYPALKIRPLIHATKQSKTKALQRPKLLHLAKERPHTDTMVARRLVSRALGLKNKQQADGGSGTEVLLPESLEQEE
ncbi:R3H and coiled-coil domain-containing protein 1 [Indicator indicator]|uniref:R3H and coiled-coil domain-containing protein 1 n=1 Tax=Indicator indicator TaxID=1002788 RepID=UPI0023DFAE35|nr:R3H and coiled-coil domain-containing protein 1 [Indicator indicator]